MAKLRHYCTLRWTSRSWLNCGGRRGWTRPPFPSWPTVKRWPLLSLTHFTLPLCPISTQAHKQTVCHTHTHTLTPPSVVSIQRAATCRRESRRCQQLCDGLNVGQAHSAKEWTGAGRASLGVEGWYVGTSRLSLSFILLFSEGSHLPTANHLRLRESL